MSSVKRSLFNLSLPNIMANIATPLLGVVDTYLMGHAEGMYLIGAVAIGGMIFNCLYWSFGFLRMGTSGMTAQAFGASNDKECAAILGRALLCALSIALVILLLQIPIKELSFTMIGNSSPDAIKHAAYYFDIRIWAAPATLCLYAFNGWFLGMQNSWWPMALAIFSNLLNMICSFYFVRWLDMGTEGVALGTVIAQYASVLAVFIILFCRYKKVMSKVSLKTLKNLELLKNFFAVNRDIFIRTLLLIGVVSFFTAYSAQFGEEVLSANSLLVQLAAMMAFAVDGIANGAESLVGKFVGAGDKSSLKEVIILSFIWGMGCGVIFAGCYYFLGEEILSLFTDKNIIVDKGMEFMLWTVLACLINPLCFIWDGIFIGAGKSQGMRNTMLFSVLLIYIPAFFLFKQLGNHGHWLAMSLFMISRGVSMSFLGKDLLKGN
ncbi:MAG: MATE family efflux transporter [Lentisphaerales bacterium]|nr:MATE family efflux transporter [Lentisphaerales bacterium]